MDIILFDEVKTALLHFTRTHEGFNLINTGNRLFIVCKDYGTLNDYLKDGSFIKNNKKQ